MSQNSNDARKAVSFEELAYSNMMIVQVLLELLAVKGVSMQKEVMESVQKLTLETNTHGPRA